MLMNNFKDKYPSEWEELCDSLPLKLEKNLDECSADIMCAALDVAHILHLFRDIPFVLPVNHGYGHHHITYNFSNARKYPPCEHECDHENKSYEKHFVKPIVTALDVIVQISEGLDVSDIVLYSDLILRLLHFIEDFEQHSFRVLIMNRCLDILHKFPSCPRCLLIKCLISQVLSSSDLSLDNESSIVALFIDQYRRHLIEEPFQKELGSFFGMLEDVRYANMCEASNYYVSIFTLVQFVALQRFNLAMLAEVKTRILDRVYSQISDYIQLEEMREKEKRDRKTATPRLPESAFDVAIKTPFEGSPTDQIQLLLFNHEQAKQCISAVLDSLP
ncbi:unnamed protein product [Angiostrongylus costaricensis]|uniref:Non-specific serine/threonine protein kinase n=1 Tax=Angiostrongylus costaricensis TaxID=334426 RepID=A0A0R3PVP5_ANGCS|nr:unnamed protein product [Angiostrongylus costaricensis]